MQTWSRAIGTYPSSDLADPLSRASIPYKPDAKGVDGKMPPHLYANFNELFRNRFEECKVGAPQRNDFSLDDFSAELDENALLAQDLGWDEGTTSTSSSYTSFDSSDSKEKGEEKPVGEVMIAHSFGEVVIAHSFKEDGDSDTSSSELNMAPRCTTGGSIELKTITTTNWLSFALVSSRIDGWTTSKSSTFLLITPHEARLPPRLSQWILRVLPGLNKEEYMEELIDEDLENSPEVAGNLSLDASEASTAAKGGSNTDVSPAM
ncbi:hypothetical protein Acr_11g0011860 [Actinidia rufa]|uniref:Uncharacterized protein n=1 Tax=Actinidia rufa TaxID=165716 RepID=A0A7J0FDU9_9ERIC|nr:hypothetical protein Acr_11g0011860 [Actinidia rufa]